MANPEVTVTLLGNAEGSALYAWADALQDIRPALAEVGKVFLENARANIAARKDPWGNGWAPVSAMTREIAARRNKTTGGGTFLPKIKVTLEGHNRVRISIESRASRSFHSGISGVKVFGRPTSKSVPARPILPIRGGRVDVPEDLMTAVRTALRQTLREALQRRSQSR